MATMKTSSFTFWELTEEEEAEGRKFTETQTHVLQNQLAICAEEKLALEYDTNNLMEFVVQDAFKQGQIALLRYLLDCNITQREIEKEVALNQNPNQ
jgi:hypothetical protein